MRCEGVGCTVCAPQNPVSCPFNGTARSILFISRSLSVQKPFIFFSTSVRSPYAFSVSFELVSFLFHLLHVVVYGFYRLLKSVHAGQKFACGRKKDSESYRSDMDSLSTRVTRFAQSHILFFAPVVLTLT